MRAWVGKDEPFCREEVSLAEAKAYFERKGYHDKVLLLCYRQKDYVTLYQLDDYRDYHQGYMVPSTGYLKWFEIVPAGDGFILHYPQRRSPQVSCPCLNIPNCWLPPPIRPVVERLGIGSVGALNDAIQEGRSRAVILVSERLQRTEYRRDCPPDRRGEANMHALC